jgi:uncharacterized membrane protein
MTKDEKLALLEDLFRQEDDRQSMVYARMYGMLAAWVRDEDLNQMLQFRGVEVAN